MQWWEVNRYLAGLHRRYHSTWEANRHLEWLLVRMFADTKKSSPPNTPQDFYKFGWEPDTGTEHQMTEEEAREFQEEMAHWNKGDFKW